jgi:hypothetical protein
VKNFNQEIYGKPNRGHRFPFAVRLPVCGHDSPGEILKEYRYAFD